ncbi:hypothetical protein [Gordonibacter sp.]|uniref:hypothetical protein n=1 Tax=Gordonibacter sp. TaxID=1968902 RepID=UPI002FCAEF7F
MEIISQERCEEGIVTVVQLSNAEKMELLDEACTFICSEMEIDDLESSGANKLQLLCDSIEPAEVSSMVASYVMGFIVHRVAERLEMVAVVAPRCVAKNDILHDSEFIFTSYIAPKPICHLSSYDPVVIPAHRIGLTEEAVKENPAYFSELKSEQSELLLDIAEEILASRIVEKIPQEALDAVRNSLLDDVYCQARWQGKTLEEFLEEQKLETGLLGMMLFEKAKDALSREVALDALFVGLDKLMTKEDIDKAAQSMEPDCKSSALDRFNRRGMLSVVKQTAGRTIARQWLLSTCVVDIEN